MVDYKKKTNLRNSLQITRLRFIIIKETIQNRLILNLRTILKLRISKSYIL